MLDEPNILLCTVDSLRKDRVNSETMPYTAELADGGIWFSDMHSTAPATAASFVSLMASRYYSDVEGIGLPDDEFVTLAEALPEGYQTVGHSANKFTSSYYNYDRGFDDFESPTSGLKFAVRRHLDEDSRLFQLLEWGYHHWLEFNAGRGEHQQSWWNESAEEVNYCLSKAVDSERPWFVWAHHMDPHHPLEPPEEYLPDSVFDRGEAQSLSRQLPGLVQPHRKADLPAIRDLYDAECRYWDDQFREMHETVPENTLVVVVGDHGELLGEHDRYGHPHEMWAELTNVPCLMYHPDLPDLDIQSLQSTIDLAPTLLSLVGQSTPPSMRGTPIDVTHPTEREQAYGTIETPDHVGAVRTDEWTWMRHESRRSTQDNDGELLFSADADDDERLAVGKRGAEDNPDVVKRLSAEFEAEIDGDEAATGHTMENEQVRQHMADLGYLEQQ